MQSLWFSWREVSLCIKSGEYLPIQGCVRLKYFHVYNVTSMMMHKPSKSYLNYYYLMEVQGRGKQNKRVQPGKNTETHYILLKKQDDHMERPC